ncbi:MAG: TraB domain-containing protein [Candidatus Woesearchaeota archaeon]|jgi:pheromone shutdown protein TraB
MTNIVFKNITIIGTSHISEESKNQVAEYIEKNKPDVVCVELDKDRMISLMTEEKEESNNNIENKYKSNKDKKKKMRKDSGPQLSLLFKVGPFGFLFYLIAHTAQKKLGSIVNLEPGADMKSALKTAQKNNIKIALIDQHVLITLKKISKAFRIKLIFRIFKDFFMALIGKGPKVDFKIDLKKVPDDKTIEKMMNLIKKTYPEIYNVLIDERNLHMARRLIVISKKHPTEKIVAVVGAGHKTGMLEYLNSMYDKIEVLD